MCITLLFGDAMCTSVNPLSEPGKSCWNKAEKI